jgi:hypothetical protein
VVEWSYLACYFEWQNYTRYIPDIYSSRQVFTHLEFFGVYHYDVYCNVWGPWGFRCRAHNVVEHSIRHYDVQYQVLKLQIQFHMCNIICTIWHNNLEQNACFCWDINKASYLSVCLIYNMLLVLTLSESLTYYLMVQKTLQQRLGKLSSTPPPLQANCSAQLPPSTLHHDASAPAPSAGDSAPINLSTIIVHTFRAAT